MFLILFLEKSICSSDQKNAPVSSSWLTNPPKGRAHLSLERCVWHIFLCVSSHDVAGPGPVWSGGQVGAGGAVGGR